MAKSTTYKDVLDYTVTYRAAWTIVGGLVAVAVVGWFAWQRFQPQGPDEKARQLVKEVTRLETRAEGCVTDSTSAGLLARLTKARSLLGTARSRLEAGSWTEAIGSAGEAKDILRQFNEQACASSTSIADFTEIEGNVKVKRVQSPRWVPASRSTRLLPGDRIWVEQGLARVHYKSGDTQTLQSGTIIEIQQYTVQPDGKSRAEIEMEHGNLTMEGAQNTDSTIHTRFGDARLDGGDIALESPEGSESLRARSRRGGVVFETPEGEERPLGPIEMVDVERRGGRVVAGPVEKDLIGPELVEPINGRVFSVEDPGDHLTVFRWQPIDGASHYRFEIARNRFFFPVLNQGHERVPEGRVDVETEAEILGLPVGRYYWRVSPVDGEGDLGRNSQVQMFNISKGSAADKRDPPELVLQSKTKVGDKVIIQGMVNPPYVRLEALVNDKKYADVPVDDQGEFNTMIPVEHEGWNVVSLVAQDTYGAKSEESFDVYWDGY